MQKDSVVKLELDLSFRGFESYLDLIEINSSLKDRLTSADVWHRDLTNWIQIVRNDNKILSPDLVSKASGISMGLELTDDKRITELNTLWRNKSQKTDVLSFPAISENMPLPDHDFLELGDIIVSVPMAKMQALDHKHELIHELRWLVSHGLLHLLGWTHKTEEGLNQMLFFQNRLLNIPN